MNIRELENYDLDFMQRMLYEAVFWKDKSNKPTLEEGISLPGVKEAIHQYGKDTDFGAVAYIEDKRLGAAWLRLYDKDNHIRGYLDDTTPVLVIAVDKEYRNKGIATKLLNWLIEEMKCTELARLSLCVSKDNHALKLYENIGFTVYEDLGDSYNMVYLLK